MHEWNWRFQGSDIYNADDAGKQFDARFTGPDTRRARPARPASSVVTQPKREAGNAYKAATKFRRIGADILVPLAGVPGGCLNRARTNRSA
jgi:hypothetical protein